MKICIASLSKRIIYNDVLQYGMSDFYECLNQYVKNNPQHEYTYYNFSFGKASNVVTNDFDADADWSRSSDARLKRNVQDTSLGLDFVNDLSPVKFQWNPSNEVPKELTSEYNEENQKNLDYVSHGFIAQEVKEVVDKHGDSSFGVWQLDGDGETQRIKKNMLVMPLIKAVQELSSKVKELQPYICYITQMSNFLSPSYY